MRRKLTLLLVSTSLIFLLIEIGLRTHYTINYRGTIEELTEHSSRPKAGSTVSLGHMLRLSRHPLLIYQLKPGLDVSFIGATVRTNSEGWREGEAAAELRSDAVRIVGLGDSVMFGWGVEESVRYMDRLEERLARNVPQLQWQAEVLAAPGYNLVMELEALKRYGLRHDPQVVIYGFVFNDLCLPNFVLQRRKSPFSMQSFLALYLRGEAGWTGLIHRHRALAEGLAADDSTAPDLESLATYCDPDSVPEEYRSLVGPESFLAALDELGKISRQRNITTVVLSRQPLSHYGLDPVPEDLLYVETGNQTRAYLEEHRYETLANSDLVLSRQDGHPSAKGHELIATSIYESLREAGVFRRLVETRGRRPRSPPGVTPTEPAPDKDRPCAPP